MAIVAALLVLVTCTADLLPTGALPLGTTIIRVRHVDLHPDIPHRHLHHHHHHYYHPHSSSPTSHAPGEPYPIYDSPPPGADVLSPESYMPHSDGYPPQSSSQGIPLPDSYMPQPSPHTDGYPAQSNIHLPHSYMPQPSQHTDNYPPRSSSSQGIPLPDSYMPQPAPSADAVDFQTHIGAPAVSGRQDGYLPRTAAAYSPGGGPSRQGSNAESSYNPNSSSPESYQQSAPGTTNTGSRYQSPQSNAI